MEDGAENASSQINSELFDTNYATSRIRPWDERRRQAFAVSRGYRRIFERTGDTAIESGLHCLRFRFAISRVGMRGGECHQAALEGRKLLPRTAVSALQLAPVAQAALSTW